ncbi:hypothetical protein GGD55_002202 [Rhizobium giardinii]|uniref:Uncharacterized protein n=1 Tax=Rhizobium giardinii TaxID=56731 RepID=A0A7W8UA43_9HYPH|nr:hypothetical protein [Rhizobium giardinii]
MRYKNPSPTPPHKGEGLAGGTYPLSQRAFHPVMPIGSSSAMPRVNPSPLWGGVGEGFL